MKWGDRSLRNRSQNIQILKDELAFSRVQHLLERRSSPRSSNVNFVVLGFGQLISMFDHGYGVGARGKVGSLTHSAEPSNPSSSPANEANRIPRWSWPFLGARSRASSITPAVQDALSSAPG